MVSQYWNVYAKEFIRERRLWVHPYFSRSGLHVLFVFFYQMGGRWLYSYCFVECCFQDLFKIVPTILVWFPAFPPCAYFVSMQCIHPYIITQPSLGRNPIFIFIGATWFPLDRKYVNSCPCLQSTSLSVDKILLPRFWNWAANIRGYPLELEMTLSCLKRLNTVLFEFT